MNIAAYCRVSTEKEDQLNSLQVQKNFFAEYAEKNGHTLVGLYTDEGLSGTRTRHRQGFLQMMQDAEQGLFQILVVKDISRLARNTVDLLQSVRRLKALGVDTVFLTANMTSMGDSEFVLTVFGALAQEESRNTSKRVKFSKRINGEKGRVPNLVYGYDKTPGDYFHLTVNPQEAAVVRQIYRWYLEEGCGTGRIANRLNRSGYRTKRDCSWSAKAVCRILRNPLYTGKVVNGKQEIEDFLTGARVDRPPSQWMVAERPELRIISDQDFHQAGTVMQARNAQFQLDRKRHSGQHLFSTLIVCKHCGWSFRRVVRTYQNTYVRWVCSKHNGQGAQNCPNAVTVDEEALISGLDQYFHRLLGDPGLLERGLEEALRALSREPSGRDQSRKQTESRLAKLEKQRNRLLTLYASDLITQQELEHTLSRSKEEVARLEADLSRLRRETLSQAALRDLAKTAMSHLPALLSIRNLTNAQLKQLIQKIEVDSDGRVDVYLLFRPSLLSRRRG